MDGVLCHSKSYKCLVARNDFTVDFQELEDSKNYGSVHIYVKVQEKCTKATCNERKHCCSLASQYFAIVEVLERQDEQLSKYRERTIVNHITRMKSSNGYTIIIWSIISRPITFFLLCLLADSCQGENPK